MHSYTFQPRAPPVRTGTADAERWSGQPHMLCGKGVRVPLGIRAIAISFDLRSGEHRVAVAEGASRGENRPFGLPPANDWLPMPTSMSPIETMRSRPYEKVPLGIGRLATHVSTTTFDTQ